MVLNYFELHSDFQSFLKNDLRVDNNFQTKFYLHLLMLLLQDYYTFLIIFWHYDHLFNNRLTGEVLGASQNPLQSLKGMIIGKWTFVDRLAPKQPLQP